MNLYRGAIGNTVNLIRIACVLLVGFASFQLYRTNDSISSLRGAFTPTSQAAQVLGLK